MFCHDVFERFEFQGVEPCPKGGFTLCLDQQGPALEGVCVKVFSEFRPAWVHSGRS